MTDPQQPTVIIHKVPDSSKSHLDNMLAAGRAFQELKQAILDEANKKLLDAAAIGDALVKESWDNLCASMGLHAGFDDPEWFMNTYFYEQTGDAYLVYRPGAVERPAIFTDAPFMTVLRSLKEPTEIN